MTFCCMSSIQINEHEKYHTEFIIHITANIKMAIARSSPPPPQIHTFKKGWYPNKQLLRGIQLKFLIISFTFSRSAGIN